MLTFFQRRMPANIPRFRIDLLRFVLLALAGCSPLGAQPVITSATPHTVPAGETVTVRGSGFTSTTKVSFFWLSTGWEYNASFTVIDDTRIDVIYPSIRKRERKFHLLVQTEEGITLGYHNENQDVGEDLVSIGPGHSGGEIPAAGAYFVEPGGVFDLSDSQDLFVTGLIMIAPGATVNFDSGAYDLFEPLIVYSPESTIIGSIPSWLDKRVVDSVTISDGIRYYTDGVRKQIAIVGGGQVEVESISGTSNIPAAESDPFVDPRGRYRFTAVPQPGYFFSGWSGASTATSSSIALDGNIFLSQSLTANFSTGRTLEVVDRDGVSVSVSPPKAVYMDGEVVTLNATVHAGYEFLGWAGDLTGSDTTLTVTMDASRFLVPLVREVPSGPRPVISGVSNAFPVAGEDVIVTGSHLDLTTAVYFVSAASSMVHPAPFEILDGDSLSITFPTLASGRSDHFLIVENPNGSAVAVPDSGDTDAINFLEPGEPANPLEPPILVVTQSAYLDLGNVYDARSLIIVEDGGILDFQNPSPGSEMHRIVYSRDAVLLGEIPTVNFGGGPEPIATEISSPALQDGVEAFRKGVSFALSVVGTGSISIVDLEDNQAIAATAETLPAYRSFRLTATPDAGMFFQGWTGALNTASDAATIETTDQPIAITATFAGGRTLSIVGSPDVTVSVDPDQALYADGVSVTLTATVNNPAKQFWGWAGDVTGNESTLEITMDRDVTIVPVAVTPDDTPHPVVFSASPSALPSGSVITVIGENLATTSAVSFLWPPLNSRNAASFEIISDQELNVTFPTLDHPTRAHYMVIETAGGTTVCAPASEEPGAIQTIGTGLDAGTSGMAFLPAGGYLDFADLERSDTHILVVANGGVIDFSNVSITLDAFEFWLSPDSVVIGDIPEDASGAPPARLFPKLSISEGMERFQIGHPLPVEIVGPGYITLTPDKTYFAPGEEVTATAFPDAGAEFIRWSGAAGGRATTVSLYPGTRAPNLRARFSTSPDYFYTWRPRHFTPEELGQTHMSDFDADPDGDSLSNAVEYAFGTDPRIHNPGEPFQMETEGDSVHVRAKRPLDAADVEYFVLVSRDLKHWYHNGDGTGKIYSVERSTDPVDTHSEEVVFEIYPAEIDAGNGAVFVRLSADVSSLF